jgi:hypothetical protein
MFVRLDVRDGLVGVVSLAVGEEVIDEHADDGEEEDNKSPEDLVGDWAVRLEDLNCSTTRQLQPQNEQVSSTGSCRWEKKARLTPGNNVQHQHDESNDTATGSCLPWLRAHGGNRSCLSEHEEGELEHSCDDEVVHIGGVLAVLFEKASFKRDDERE